MTEARRVAFETVVATFRDGEHADRAFRRLAAGLGPRDRARAKWLAYGAIKRRDTLDAAIAGLTDRSLRRLDAEVLNGLRLGVYELMYGDTPAQHAVVNETVEVIRRAGAGRASGFANAVMRRAASETGRLQRDHAGEPGAWAGRDLAPEELARAYSYPQWLVSKWVQELGPDLAREALAAGNQVAESAVRVNLTRWSVREARAQLRATGLSSVEVPAFGGLSDLAILALEGSWESVEGWIADGYLTPQSRGSAAVVSVLDPQPGEQVLEIAAGPGTKTGQIAERLAGRGELIAVELDVDRAKETADQLERLGMTNATVVEADAAATGFGEQGFNRVLVDAPCSDLGALASRPDARWRKSPRMIDELVDVQRRLLRGGIRHVAPGGSLVYSTCTISRSENEDQVAELELEMDGEIEIDDLGAIEPRFASPHDPRCIQILPGRFGTTGFFIARIHKA